MDPFTDFLEPAPPAVEAVLNVTIVTWNNKDMSSTRNSEKWLLLKWTSGGISVVNLKSVKSPTTKICVGLVVFADRGNGTRETATVIGSSHDRGVLEKQVPKEEPGEDETAGSSKNEEPKDFSASASSWEPSDDHPSSDDEEMDQKKIKLERNLHRSYINRRTSKILKPSHRANAINNIIAKNRKRTFDDTRRKEKSIKTLDRKSLPDSTRKNNIPTSNKKSDIVSINVQDIMHMKQSFQELFTILNEIKPYVPHESNGVNNLPQQELVKDEINNTTNVDEDDEMEASDRSEEFNRSDDNVLITNKYENAINNHQNSNKNVLTEKNTKKEKLDEWMPIGSGQTLIHRDQYRKINWKSYTIATRTLLLAVFPRRILATHSLTGKKSPAFLNKPAKMCLDPKIVTDVVTEICDRFKVKENLVRSIITTKCADECKMLKTRMRKTLPANQKPMVKTTHKAEDEANITC